MSETWQIRHFVVATRNWWFGKKVLLPVDWAREVSWEERRVHVALTRATIRSAPAWQADERFDAEYDSRLRRHYGHAS